MLEERTKSGVTSVMDNQLQERFITAAMYCAEKLSECPELKNYRIYRQHEALPHQLVQACTTTHVRRRSEQWMLVVSAKRLSKSRSLAVEVRGCR